MRGRPTRVGVPSQAALPRRSPEAQGILAHPQGGGRVVEAGAAIEQAGLGVVVLADVAEAQVADDLGKIIARRPLLG